MKKVFALTIALAMLLSFAACGGEKITLVEKSIHGIKLTIPNDMGEFVESDGGAMASSESANISITAPAPNESGITPDMIDQASFQEMAIGFDVEFISYDNAATMVGAPAIFSNFKGTNDSGTKVLNYSYMIFHEDGTLQSVIINMVDGGGSSVEANIDAIIASVQRA